MASTGLRRTERVVQLVSDLTGKRLGSARVLDLGCNDGGFSLELARLGAREVLAIEGREANLAKAIASRDAEGLTQIEFLHGDARDLSRERHGQFDVVLCLGLLYHLDVPAVFEFARALASVCRGYALVETQVGLSAKQTVRYDGKSYEGLWYDEDVAQAGASLDNRRSFWPTKPSLVNLLADAGFTSVAEVLHPVVPTLAPYRDHTLLLAAMGDPLSEIQDERLPEAPARMGHPAQGARYVLRDRLARRRGGGLPSLFR
ncbi:MAG TPA: methyltransferase domain-containing protein [Thermoleophilaceae bacterium]|jgi:SAM-dependent methyltransferase